MTATDNGVPARSGSAIFIVPLGNYNVNPPTYTAPVVVNAAINLPIGSFVSRLNAYDIDGDLVTYTLSTSSKLSLYAFITFSFYVLI